MEFFFFAFVALLKNQQHPTYGLGKVRTTGGSDIDIGGCFNIYTSEK